MNSISVETTQQYNVLIGSGLLSNIIYHISSICCSMQVVIISDHNVWPLYGRVTEERLTNAGYHVIHYIMSAGEGSKSSETYLDILNYLSSNRISRADTILAIGGGVVGDIAGFTAATYLRGIAYVQIPTSLLAMVDSSVGGKTAINLPAGKNLAGAFYSPKLVLCDLDTLSTLPKSIFVDGCAEIIKYALLFDPVLFSHLEAHGIDFDQEYVICRCVELKARVVATDEFDNGKRQLLNLGHTIGHAIEKISNFKITHGYAVAIGMHVVCCAAAHLGYCDSSIRNRVYSMLQSFSLPCRFNFTANEIVDAALIDKKRFGANINLIIPLEIGNCKIESIPISELKSIIEAGL